jgi:hypothetical protein
VTSTVFTLLAVRQLDEVLEELHDTLTVSAGSDGPGMNVIAALYAGLQLGKVGLGQMKIKILSSLDTIPVRVSNRFFQHSFSPFKIKKRDRQPN